MTRSFRWCTAGTGDPDQSLPTRSSTDEAEGAPYPAEVATSRKFCDLPEPLRRACSPQTIDLIGSAPARMAQAQTDVLAGALSIRPFQVSRWRLRRTRHLWVFNGGLVLGYGLERGFWERMDRPFGGLIAGGEGGYFGDFGVLLVMRSGEASIGGRGKPALASPTVPLSVQMDWNPLPTPTESCALSLLLAKRMPVFASGHCSRVLMAGHIT